MRTEGPGKPAAKARKLGSARARCQFARRLSHGLVLLTLSGCFRNVNDAPVAPGSRWETLLGNGSRSAFVEGSSLRQIPTQVWRTRVGRGLDSPPAILGTVAVTSSTNRMVSTVSIESGEVFWERRKKGPFSASPVADEERIYVVTSDIEGRAYGLRRRDGDERWEKRVSGSEVAPLLVGESVVVAGQDGVMVALQVEDGERRWERRLPARIVTTPLAWDDRLLVAAANDSLYVLSIEDGQVTTRFGAGVAIGAALAEKEGVAHVVLESGELLALGMPDLKELWRAEGIGVVAAAPVIDDEAVFLLDQSGTVRVVEGGRVRELARLGGAADRSLSLVGSTLVVGLLDGRLIGLDSDSGDTLWTLRFDDSITHPVAMQDGILLVPLRRGDLVGLKG